MKKLDLILILLFISLNSFGQISNKELQKEWFSNNINELYYNSDTILLHKTDNKICDVVKWKISKKEFQLDNKNLCSDYSNSEKGEIKLSKTDYGQILTLKTDNRIIDKFRILEFVKIHSTNYKYDLNKIKLLRFDNIKDERLYKYVDSLIFKVLNYDPKKSETLQENLIKNAAATTSSIKIREGNWNSEPLIIMNGHIVENKAILKHFLLAETYQIVYLTKEKSASIYGYRALNGVIILVVSNKIFKKRWKKTTGNTS